jgi:hypothetical protein
MLRYFQDNWLAIVSLIVGAAGGIPGILSVLQHFRDKPGFAFTLSNWITGEISDFNGVREPFILLSGTVANSGKQALSPSHFELVLEVGAKRYQAEKMLIPESVQFQSEHQDIDIESPWRKDLQRFASVVPPGLPVEGFLMYRLPNVPLVDLRRPTETRFALICVDVFGRRHSFKVLPDPKPMGVATVYPKHGITVRNRV